MIDEFHIIQRRILNDLLLKDKLKFSSLKPAKMEGSKFTFHLTRLVDQGLVEKQKDIYVLTPVGKYKANSYDNESKHPTLQAKLSVVFCAFRTIDNIEETLIYTRKKNPYYDHQGYPTGKVRYGENISNAAEREFHEETNLDGKAILKAIRHYRVFYPGPEELVEDKVMYIHKIDNPTGVLKSNYEGEFCWKSIKDVSKMTNKLLPEFPEIFEILTSQKPHQFFKEVNHYPKDF